MAADQRALELGAALHRNLLARECAEAGRDAIVRRRVCGERLDDRASGCHPGKRLDGQLDSRVMACDRDDVIERERANPERNWRRGDGLGWHGLGPDGLDFFGLHCIDHNAIESVELPTRDGDSR